MTIKLDTIIFLVSSFLIMVLVFGTFACLFYFKILKYKLEKPTVSDLQKIPSQTELTSVGFLYKLQNPTVEKSWGGIKAISNFSDYKEGVGEYFIYLFMRDQNMNKQKFIDGVNVTITNTIKEYLKGDIVLKKIDLRLTNLDVYYLDAKNAGYDEEGYYIGGIISGEYGLSMSVSYPKGKYTKGQVKKLVELIISKNKS